MHRLILTRLYISVLATLILCGVANPTFAARSAFPPKTSDPLSITSAPKSTVSIIQKSLRKIGLYRGPIDGRANEAIRLAIRQYQKMHGMKVNGNITQALANLLDTGSRVDTLLQIIDRARQDNIRIARESLLSRPETHHLLEKFESEQLLKEHNSERADPTRDSKSCFKKPTVKCLLFEAAESAKGIYKKEMRDWALGELLVVQTKAGLTKEAMATTRRIHDPRLIVVALRNIAEAQAIAGRVDEALTAAEIIPGPIGKSEAYTAIAEIQAKQKDKGKILDTFKLLHAALSDINDPMKQLYFLTRSAIALSKSGHRKKAQAYLREAKKLFKNKLTENSHDTALRYIAIAFADLDQPQEALLLLKKVRDHAERTPVLVRTASAQARAGKNIHAITTATDITTLRYRAVALSKIAMSQAKQHQPKQAWRTIHIALDAAEGIKLPFAQSFAFSSIARTLAAIGVAEGKHSLAFSKAKEIIQKVGDDRLRAHGYWIITAEQRRVGSHTKAKETRRLAENETNDIKSHLSKIWMLSDVADSHLKHNEKTRARDALDRAIDSARLITNAWERTRALAKIAELWLNIRTNGFQTAQRLP